MLYYCSSCGYWRHVAFSEAVRDLSERFAKAMKVEVPARPEGYACPHGHGMMTRIEPDRRISLREPEPIIWMLPLGDE